MVNATLAVADDRVQAGFWTSKHVFMRHRERERTARS